MSATAPPTRGEKTAIWVVVVFAGVLGLIGFANSYYAVERALRPSFGWLSWSGPIGIDVAIAVFSGIDILLAKHGIRMRWLRLFPWSLVTATIYLNVAGETTWVGRIAHTALPLLWITAVEVAAHIARVWARIHDDDRRDRIEAARWVLAPVPTLVLWRRSVLWGVRRYGEALTRERVRQHSVAALREKYHGRMWRLRAPYRERVRYRLGEALCDCDTCAATEVRGFVRGFVPTPVPGANPPPQARHEVREQSKPGRGPNPKISAIVGDTMLNGREKLTRIIALVPATDVRTNTDLANEYAEMCGLSTTTARKYVIELRRERRGTPEGTSR